MRLDNPPLIPAKAGIQSLKDRRSRFRVAAFAGTSGRAGSVDHRRARKNAFSISAESSA